MNWVEDFICREERAFKVRFGNTLASALAGFVAGALAASIILATALYLNGLWFGK